jgi:ribosome-binding protein aMBF1 (putative translation factor)
LVRDGHPASSRRFKCTRCGRVIADGRKVKRDPRALCRTCAQTRQGPTFGQRLRAYRLLAGLTQGEVERETGIPRRALGRFEWGKMRPDTDTVRRLSAALGIGVGELRE